MKPQLERMVDLVVAALSGKAKQFYDLEFDFFNEVTSISGKLKPYIKKSKPEKKVDQEAFAQYCLLTADHLDYRPRSTKKWQRLTSRSASICQVTLME
jgi:hypothetical protein